MKKGGRVRGKAHYGWWFRASDDQRLAQVDAGIELGLTARQVALCCGHRGPHAGTAVINFALGHDRHFPDAQRQRAIRTASDARNDPCRARAAYFGGAAKEALWQDGYRAAPADDDVAEVSFE